MITLTVGLQFVSQHKDWDLGCHRYHAFHSDQQCSVELKKVKKERHLGVIIQENTQQDSHVDKIFGVTYNLEMEQVEVEQPNTIKVYNTHMGSVDLLDNTVMCNAIRTHN
ncbi:hypothetical protein E2C01_013700 [Portunus trituberculatus]|uniref:Uncharacterized protein n=1 Tax=Portunus trituberculatus TaxID=210409 RepID=A0A5B7DHR3_PORTR|nr:hypothetical protein [Portunus trituberculatus]